MGQREPPIDLKEAAELLGYSVPGLRKVVNRSRRKLRGQPVNGPTITFFQAGQRSPIKFKREWVEDFIRRHTCDPSVATPVEATLATPAQKSATELISQEVGSTLGFDPALYDV